ncbi:hypothetical protein [Gilvimarinus chinensis]|uniref:hypothetical protein n=1 Tax=Gilvimarinus chinensis TaxID=396005 RepID=UPI0003640AFE|nr:hypothetical protein [Gilvimarinus chinensis]
MDTSDAQRARLQIFELVVYWEGAANSSLLVKHFGLSRQQASQDIKRYLELAPNNLSYNTRRKCHQPESDFKPLFITRLADQYLAWLAQPLAIETLPIYSLSLPARGVSAALIWPIVQAIHNSQANDYIWQTTGSGITLTCLKRSNAEYYFSDARGSKVMNSQKRYCFILI